MKTNYHTHTYRCGHAIGHEEEYIKKAIESGYKIMGFAEHTPHLEGGRVDMRMRMDDLLTYSQSIRSLKEKYADQITIYVGLECEYFEEMLDTYRKWLDEKVVDYLIFGNHYDKFYGFYFGNTRNELVLKKYIDLAIKGLETGLFKYLAHPDLFMRGYPTFDDKCVALSTELCLKAKELDIPLEYNLGGLRYQKRLRDREYYPHDKFFEIAAKVGNKVIIGGDFHAPDEIIDDYYDEVKEKLINMGCNVIETLEI